MILWFYSLLLISGISHTDLSRSPIHPSSSQPNFAPEILIDEIQPASCSGSTDGAIFITVKQAELPYTVLWSNGDTNEDLTGIEAGVYSCTVTDANGETSSLNGIEVEGPELIVVTADIATPPDCLGNPGFIAVSAEGGTPDYEFIWNTGDTTPELSSVGEGTYSVTVTDLNGCSASLDVTLTTEYPQAATADALINCANAVVALSGDASTSGPDISYAWTTANGQILSNPDSVVVYVGSGGLYHLLVTNTLTGCTAEAEATVSVDSVPPFVDLGDDITVSCTNTVDTLFGDGSTGPGYTYQWLAINGGHLISGASSLNAVFDHTGTFVLTIQNTENGCMASDTIVVTGLNTPPSALASADTLNCLQDSLTLTAQYDTLNTQIIWQGPGGFSSTLPAPKIGDPGSYILTVTDTLTGCFVNTTALIMADTSRPAILYTFGGTLDCSQTELLIGVEVDTAVASGFYWSGPGDFESFEQSPEVNVAGEYFLTVTNLDNGCFVVDTVLVEGDFALPIADAGGDQLITCTAPSLELDGSGSTQGDEFAYAWSTADGQILSGDSTLSPLVDAAGTYVLTVFNLENGCTATDETLVGIETTQPLAEASVGDTLSCDLTEITLSGSVDPTDDVEYAWDGPDGFASSDLNPVVTEPGLYTLSVTYLPSGCTASASVTVVSTAPVAQAGPDKSLTCSITEVTLEGSVSNAGPDAIYFWTTADGNIVSGDSTLNPLVNAAGTYTLTIIDTLSNCANSSDVIVVLNTTAPQALAGPNGLLTCAAPTVSLDGSASSGSGSLQFAWSTNEGNIISGANTATPEVDEPGEYYLALTDLSNGCTAYDTTVVEADLTLPVATASAFGSITCVSVSVPLNGNSSVPGSSFSWVGPNGFVSSEQNPVVSNPGAYTLTVQHPVNGCTGTATAVVQENTMPPTLTASAGVLTCSQPSVAIMTSATPANATFLWIGPGGFSSTAQNPMVSQPGTYSLVATNPANGCTNSVSALVSQNITPPTVSAPPAGTLTCLQTTVTLNATATPAGAGFSWSGPDGFSSNLQNPVVDQPGIYSVTVTHPVNGCTNTTLTFVESNAIPPTAYAGADQPLSCQTGFLTLNGIGSSTGPQITYNWTTLDGNIVIGQNSLMPRVDAAGTYTLLVTNTANGCTATDEVEVSLPSAVTAVISQSQSASCNGGSDGSATVQAGGGTLVYFYNWSSGAQTATASNLSAGVYAVTVTDQAACSAIASVTIGEPTALNVTIAVTPETLPDANNGTATASVLGGTMPYSYLWSTNATTASISNLAPGAYTFTATDANGCTATGIANINESTCALSALVLTTPVSCFGNTNGSATANVGGASGAISYAWSNGATTQSIQNLAAGAYSLTVSDAAGCQVFVSAQIGSPQILTTTLLSQQNVLCANDLSGALSVAVSGGNSPYSYVWSNGGTSNSLNNLGPNVYSLTTTDANGCTDVFSESITATDETAPLLLLNNASVALNANGIATFGADLFDSGTADGECDLASLTVSPSSFGCSELGEHVVTLTATDVNGNSATGTAIVTIVDNTAPTLSCPANIATGACQPTVQFAQPVITDNCAVVPAQLVQQSGLPSGSEFPSGETVQSFIYTDAAGNSGACSFTVTVSPPLTVATQSTPSACGLSCDGSISLDISGGALPYGILWNTGANTADLSGLCPGDYAATVTDGQGCSQVLSFVIESADDQAPVLLVENATVALGADGTVQVSAADFDNGSSDNCDVINWTLSETDFDCSGLGEHVITLSATDNSGNSAQQSVVLTIVDNIAPTLICPDDLVVGLCNATVEYSLPIVLDNCDTGAPVLSAGLPSGSDFPLGATNVVFTATDPSGNTGTCNFTVQVDESFIVTTNVSEPTCAGLCNGSISLNINGPGAPFTIQWSNGNTTPSLTALCAGDYSATITDITGCSAVFSFILGAPDALSIGIDDVDQDINDQGVGAISVTVSGGTPAYTFNWLRNGAPFASTEDLTGLHIGTYQLILTDANGCSLSGPSIVIINNISDAAEPDFLAGWVLAPNPASDQTVLRFTQALPEQVGMFLYDASGRLIRNERIAQGTEQFTIDLSDLPAGMMQLRLLGESGSLSTKTLIKIK